MKVESSRATRSSGAKRTAKQEAGSSGAFAREMLATGGAGDGAEPAAATPVSAVDALLAVQEVGDATSEGGNRQAFQRGADILDRLDAIRMGLLAGRIPLHQLESLTQLVARQRETNVDPQLSVLLDDIDLRARVELAKLERERR